MSPSGTTRASPAAYPIEVAVTTVLAAPLLTRKVPAIEVSNGWV